MEDDTLEIDILDDDRQVFLVETESGDVDRNRRLDSRASKSSVKQRLGPTRPSVHQRLGRSDHSASSSKSVTTQMDNLTTKESTKKKDSRSSVFQRLEPRNEKKEEPSKNNKTTPKKNVKISPNKKESPVFLKVHRYPSIEEALTARREKRAERRREKKKAVREQILGTKPTSAPVPLPPPPPKISGDTSRLRALEPIKIVMNATNDKREKVVIHPTPSNVLQDDMETDEYSFPGSQDQALGFGDTDPIFYQRGRSNRYRVALPPAPGAQEEMPPEKRKTHYEFVAADTAMKFFSIRDKWTLLERELLLADIYRETPVQDMPAMPVQFFIDYIQTHCYRGECHQLYHAYFDKPVETLTPEILSFIKVVKDTRTLSLNTEGTGFTRKEKNEFVPRVMITIGAADGRVLFFNRHDIMPQELLDFITDPTYTKIGSGLEKEMLELKRVGISARNWVEIGCLRMALYPPTWEAYREQIKQARENGNNQKIDVPYGISAMIDDLLKAGYFKDYKRTKYRYDKFERIKGQINREYVHYGKPPAEMLPHLRENARIPFAELILIVATFAKDRGYDLKKEPFWPIVHEAFDLCRLRDPKTFQENIKLDPERNYWISYLSTGEDLAQASLPSACYEMVDYFRARVDYREPYVQSDLLEASSRVFERFFGPNGIPFPDYQHVATCNASTLISRRCASCGREGHDVFSCPQDKNPVCEYPHDTFVYGPHSTLCCPHLHNYCTRCQMIGHKENVHWSKESSILMTCRELRKRYFEFMERGLLTSIPLLIHHPEGRKKISSNYWRLSIDCRRFNQALIARYALKVTKYVPMNAVSAMQQQQGSLLWKKQREHLLEAVRYNVNLQECAHVKIPRDLQQKFVIETAENRRKKSKEQSKEDRELVEARRELREKLNNVERLIRQRAMDKRRQDSRQEQFQAHRSKTSLSSSQNSMNHC